MPAEAIHLSALDDTLPALSARWRVTLDAPAPRSALRLGALFVDLPYFEAVITSLLAHVLKLRPRPQPWGDRFHQQAPITVGIELAAQGAALRARGELREAGEQLVALALGYLSHAAVDSALHPLVNELAASRAQALGEHPLRQHHEVEKFHSVLFHHERHGRDYLGTPELARFLELDTSLLWRPGPVAEAAQAALRAALGQAPRPERFARWGQGYARYVALISGPLGRGAVSEADKERERPALYARVGFPDRYAAAVARSQRWVAALCDALDAGPLDEPARAALLRLIPEQSIDPTPDGPIPDGPNADGPNADGPNADGPNAAQASPPAS